MKKLFLFTLITSTLILDSCKSDIKIPIISPVVTTTIVTNVNLITATSGGTVTADIETKITARGVVWSTSPKPTIEGNEKTSNGTGTGSFTSELTELIPGTTYYVRAYATNSKGTDYGAGQVFTATPIKAPDFSIVKHTDVGFTATDRKIDVFGIPIYAYAGVEDTKLIHAANLMAQYLDNNEDETVDDLTLLNALHSNNATLFLWKDEKDLSTRILAQDLGADETRPAWHTDHTGPFDAALEEVWHVITASGYNSAYPEIFGEKAGTSLTNAMDLARGGRYTTIPKPYPANAWYTYDDKTCDYACMASEYIYWAMSSILGAQKNRLHEISDEWDLNTKALVEKKDPAIYSLLTDTQYKFPTVLPDGTYRK